IQIREAGIDPLEAVFATGVRRFDKSGEYKADGALSLTAWLRWKCKLSGGAAMERVEIARQLEKLPQTEAAFASGEVGYQHVAGLLDAEGGATRRTALQPFMKPIPNDDRSYAQRSVDALMELCRQGGSGGKRDGAGPRPQLIIRASLDTLAGTKGAPAGELDGGGTVPAETVQRYACDSAISRITGQGELEHELNHASRTLPASTRRALEARDRHCVFPGCTRPTVWCDGHHLVWWTRGGATALPNLALLCRPHHRMVHEEGWRLIRHQDGRFSAMPPPRPVLPHARSA